MSHFFAYLSRMKHIQRWGLMRNTNAENVQEHSLQVAVVAHALATIRNERFGGKVDANRTVVLAIFHDVTEVITGDLPTPIKHFNPEVEQVHRDLEGVARERLLALLPDEFRPTYDAILDPRPADAEALELVKAADKLCSYLKCLEELKAGNQEFSKAKATIEKSLRKSKTPEVEVFLKEFAPSFSLTLDELNPA